MKSFKKLSTKSAIFISLTSMMGAGIFIKVRTLNVLAHNNVTPIVFLFLFFLVGMWAFSYVLMKIIPSQTGNMGFMEWSKSFCGKKLHQDFYRFVKNLYYPVSLFLFSVYGVLGITGEQLGILATLGLAMSFILLFLVINFISFKWSKYLQILLSFLVIIPLFLLPLMGLISPGGDVNNIAEDVETFWGKLGSNEEDATGLDSWGPWMILISGLPSLLFIYDGFYSIASLKSKLKKPKNLAAVIVISMALVNLIYLNVIVGFNLGDPKYANFRNFKLLLKDKIAVDIFDLLIGCASFLTLNSIIMGCFPQLRAMHAANRFEDVERIKRYIFYRRENEDGNFEEKFCILLSVIWKTLACFLIAGVWINIVTYFDLTKAPKNIFHSVADIITIFIFIILLAIIVGSRKRHDLAGESQLFRWCTKLCGGIILTALGYLIISYLVGITGYRNSDIFSSWSKIIVLFIFSAMTFYPRIFSLLKRLNRRKKSIYYEKYESGNIITLE